MSSQWGVGSQEGHSLPWPLFALSSQAVSPRLQRKQQEIQRRNFKWIPYMVGCSCPKALKLLELNLDLCPDGKKAASQPRKRDHCEL